MPHTAVMPRRTPYYFLLLPVLLYACDLFTSDEPPTPCQRAKEVVRGAYAKACEGKQAACCFCQCWNDGRKDYDRAQYRADGTCKCLEATQDRNCQCKGEQLAIAERCLENQEACQTEATNFVSGESGLCTLTPL